MSLPVLDILLYHTLLIVIAGAVGFAWGLSEIVDAFAFDMGHALRTRGAWLLLLTNAFAAAGTYVFIASIVPGLDTWYAALFTSLAWPVVIRNANIKLAARVTDAATSNDPPSAAIRFEQIYARFQDLARRWINAALAQQRAQLILRAMQLELAELTSYAQRLAIASPLQESFNTRDDEGKQEGQPSAIASSLQESFNTRDDEGKQEGQPSAIASSLQESKVSDVKEKKEKIKEKIKEFVEQHSSDDEKKALLAAFILTNFGREALETFIRQHPRPGQQPAGRQHQRGR